jgi:hypothetical protein
MASQRVARNIGMQQERVIWYAGKEVKIFTSCSAEERTGC